MPRAAGLAWLTAVARHRARRGPPQAAVYVDQIRRKPRAARRQGIGRSLTFVEVPRRGAECPFAMQIHRAGAGDAATLQADKKIALLIERQALHLVTGQTIEARDIAPCVGRESVARKARAGRHPDIAIGRGTLDVEHTLAEGAILYAEIPPVLAVENRDAVIQRATPNATEFVHRHGIDVVIRDAILGLELFPLAVVGINTEQAAVFCAEPDVARGIVRHRHDELSGTGFLGSENQGVGRGAGIGTGGHSVRGTGTV